MGLMGLQSCLVGDYIIVVEIGVRCYTLVVGDCYILICGDGYVIFLGVDMVDYYVCYNNQFD